jgi:hypothetical protein
MGRDFSTPPYSDPSLRLSLSPSSPFSISTLLFSVFSASRSWYQGSSPSFSVIYELPNFQILSFHNDTNCRGWGTLHPQPSPVDCQLWTCSLSVLCVLGGWRHSRLFHGTPLTDHGSLCHSFSPLGRLEAGRYKISRRTRRKRRQAAALQKGQRKVSR